ncbi:MAG: type II secretion system F family protein, partial [Pseudomonadota bacterium]
MAQAAAATKTQKPVVKALDLYTWEGVDKQGKKVKGEMSASGVAFVNSLLRRQGIRPVKVAKRRGELFKFKKKIAPKDIAIFARQLATMMEAGIPVAQSFDIVGRGHENPSMQELIMAIKTDVESGTNLTAALGKFPLYFDALFCNLVQAGEQAGILDS